MSEESCTIKGCMFLLGGWELLEREKKGFSPRFLNLKKGDHSILRRNFSTQTLREVALGSEMGLGIKVRPLLRSERRSADIKRVGWRLQIGEEWEVREFEVSFKGLKNSSS